MRFRAIGRFLGNERAREGGRRVPAPDTCERVVAERAMHGLQNFVDTIAMCSSIKIASVIALCSVCIPVIAAAADSPERSTLETAPAVVSTPTASKVVEPYDPLASFQWVLFNLGNVSFGSPSKRRIDLNVRRVHRMGITGKGVRVMIVDGGLDARHEDLAANVDRSMLHTFLKGVEDPTATDVGNEIGIAHGTAMAGIVAAVAGNGVGGRGIAPGATLGASKLYDGFEPPSAQALNETFGGAPFSRNTDVFSSSNGFGFTLPTVASMEESDEVRALSQLFALRNGKGAVVVKPAGNTFDVPDAKPCDLARRHGLTCAPSGLDPSLLLPQAIVVASVNAMGRRSSFSQTGANVLVSGIGGDVPASPSGPVPAQLITTDISGCERGVSAHKPLDGIGDLTDFDRPGTPVFSLLNAHCNYMSISGGTSSATATVTGVVALMLEANPDLTWRDIRVILARTSRRLDSDAPARAIQLKHGSYVAQQGWTRNAAGLWFHDAYGYGLVDAYAAVVAAKGWQRHLSGLMLDSGWIEASSLLSREPWRAVAIPRQTATGVGGVAHVAQSGRVEYVQVRVSFKDVAYSDLGVELVSPSGTRSVLLAPYSGLNQLEQATDVVFASNAFMSERTDGDWSLSVIHVGKDGESGPDAPGAMPVLKGWSLRVMGEMQANPKRPA